ncbi:MAG: ABC transporter permease [Egibacteraceae bacterium]
MTAAIGPLPRLPLWRRPRFVRWALVIALLSLLEVATRTGVINKLTAPPPSLMVTELSKIIGTAAFMEDLGRTLFTIAVAFAIGFLLGLPLGVLFWRVPGIGRVLEPFVVTMYAMPTLVFYPILLALMGLNAGPIITIAALMALIPIALNTMVALRSIQPTLHKLAASVNCSRVQYYTKVLMPAATPLAIPGIRLGFIYTIIGTIAMEFILASRGIGFRTGLNYRDFNIPEMYGYVLVVVVLSVGVNSLFGLLERRIRRDML